MEKAVKVTASSAQALAWRWYSDQRVRIRPQEFWASNSQITVDLKLFGLDFGNKMIGNSNARTTFKVGPQRVAVVDDITKTMNVYFDGKLVRTAPVTLGDADWLSPTGCAVIMEQERNSKFNAGSIGLKPGDKGYLLPAVDRRVRQQADFLRRLRPPGAGVGVGCSRQGQRVARHRRPAAGRCRLVLQQHENRRSCPDPQRRQAKPQDSNGNRCRRSPTPVLRSLARSSLQSSR